MIKTYLRFAIAVILLITVGLFCISCAELLGGEPSVTTKAPATTQKPPKTTATATTAVATTAEETVAATQATEVPQTTAELETTEEPEITVIPETTAEPEETDALESEPEDCAHSYSVLLSHKPTCTVNGFTVYSCEDCGDVKIGDEIKAEGHSFGEWVVVETPTADKNGYDKKVCSACQHEHTRETRRGDPISPALGNITYGYFSFASCENREEMQDFYRKMLEACESFSDSDRNVTPDQEGRYVIEYIDVKEYTTPTVELASVWKIFVENNPSYYWLSNDILIRDGKLFLAINEAYASGEYRKQCDKAIDDMTKEAMSLISNTDSDLEIALKLHDYLTEKLTYAYVEGTNIPESSVWAYNIIGAAINGKGVCEAYAKTYLYLCTVGGLECIFVSGRTHEPHAWNYVKLHDEWYAVDVTWDDGNNKYNKYNYFGLSESSIAIDHISDTPDIFGLYYLYELPKTAENDLAPVIVYEDGVLIDTYKNADEAFTEMVDELGEYTVEFLKNDTVIEAKQLPAVQSITFIGMNEELDDQYFYGESTLTFSSAVSFRGTVTFRNVCVRGEIDLGENILITDGFFCRLSGVIKGGDSALIKVKTAYMTDIKAETSVKTER